MNKRGWSYSLATVLLVGLLGIRLQAAELTPSQAYVITKAMVILEPGSTLDEANIVVRKGIIEAVGPVKYGRWDVGQRRQDHDEGNRTPADPPQHSS